MYISDKVGWGAKCGSPVAALDLRLIKKKKLDYLRRYVLQQKSQ